MGLKQATINYHDIAIVGMAGVFPGAKDIEAYWKNIVGKVNSIVEVTTRWRTEDMYDPAFRTQDRSYSKWGGLLDEMTFDPTEFGIPPVTLASVEAIQLLALKTAKNALADAGFYERDFPRERTAVIFGTGGLHDQCIDYIFRTMLSHYLPRIDTVSQEVKARLVESCNALLPEWTEDSFPGMLSNVISGRVANRLDLNGSNFTVDAACAASLAAVDIGMLKLRTGAADAVVVGAVDMSDNIMGFTAFAQTLVLAPDGKSRPFDNAAKGIVISEGAAALVLKRLADAVKDGDRIHAVIKGLGSSSDGRFRSLTAPNPEGQVLALKRAYADAGISPDTIELIEAHGTGTVVGDKSEFRAMQAVFGGKDGKTRPCAVGSVKSNMGHTKTVAGLAAMIKAVLAMKHRVLPATIGIEKPNTRIDFSKSRLYLNTENRPWIKTGEDQPRRCGVSAFGFGGTNFHVILEEHPEADAHGWAPPLRDAEVFVFSATDRAGLCRKIEAVMEKLKYPEHTDMTATARVLHRQSMETEKLGQTSVWLSIVAESLPVLKEKLTDVVKSLYQDRHPDIQNGTYYNERPEPTGKVCFLFPGQGSQKVNMFRELLTAFPACQKVFEHANMVLADWFEAPLSRWVYPEPVFSKEEQETQAENLNDTRIAQPAMAAADLTALDLLKRLGIHPDFCAGHSFGEFIALHAAGVIETADVLTLSAMRGKLAAETSVRNKGKMAVLKADADAAAKIIADSGTRAWIANVNAPGQTVIGGRAEDIEKCLETARIEKIQAGKIPVTAAFHTPLMGETAKELSVFLEKIKFRSPVVPVYSNTTGSPYPKTAPAIRKLLARHIMEPVNFISEINNLYDAGARYFIEVGPGRVLSGLVDRILGDKPHMTMPMDASGDAGTLRTAHFLARMHAARIPVDLSCWFGAHGASEDLDALSAKAASLVNPPPTTWRIKDGKVRPWHDTPTHASSRKPVRRKINQTTQNVISPGVLQSGGFQETAMEKDRIKQNTTNHGETENTAGSAPSSGLLHRIQANLEQFADMQRSQQRLMERFLDMQQQIMDAVLNSKDNTSPGMAEYRVPTFSLKSQGVDGTDGFMHRPPAPTLPDLKAILTQNLKMENPIFPIPEPPRAYPHIAPGSQPDLPLAAAATHPGESGPLPGILEFQADLRKTVSALTGYPEEMLGMDAHLEADLGIDSIKRVEILSILEEKHPVLEIQAQEALLEELAGLNTLQKIVDWYGTLISHGQELQNIDGKKHEEQETSENHEADAVDMEENAFEENASIDVRRFIVLPRDTSPVSEKNGGMENFPRKDIVLLVGDAPEIKSALAKSLKAENLRIKEVSWGNPTTVTDNEHCTVQPMEIPQQIARSICPENERVGAVIHLAGFHANGNTEKNGMEASGGFFHMLKAFESDLKASAADGGGRLFTITAMGGDFGYRPCREFVPEAAGVVGITKTAALEWPAIHARCIDVDPTMDPDKISDRLWKEFTAADHPGEAGINREGRWTLCMEESVQASGSPQIDTSSVLLMLGGGSGITAEIAKEAARRYQPCIILGGLSPLEGEESSETRNLKEKEALRAFFIRSQKEKGKPESPSHIERRIARLLKNRQLKANLHAMRKAGARVEYHALDVKNASALSSLIEDVYARFGRIDGVVHGAGIIEDHLIRDKSMGSFNRVFQTKVVPAKVFARRLKPESLKFLVFFSSVAGRFGNPGQCDYSAANEVLNKMAHELAAKWTNTRVVSIGWGPWQTGMVSEELKRLYRKKGVGLIPTDTGVDFFFNEIGHHPDGPPEIIISTDLQKLRSQDWSGNHP